MKGLFRKGSGLVRSLLVVAGLLGLSSCSSFEGPTTQLNAAENQREGSSQEVSIGGLGPGDVISVNFIGAPELNLRQRIRGDGKVSLPMVGDVSAGGKALAQFQSELVKRYRAHLKDPNLVVSRESTAAAVYVSGGVNNPTKIALDRPMTALEAIMEAGGFAPGGNPRKVVVVRKDGGARKRFVLDLKAAMDGSSTSVFYLRPFDVISVSQRVW